MIIKSTYAGALGVPCKGSEQVVDLSPGYNYIANDVWAKARPNAKRILEAGSIVEEWVKTDVKDVSDKLNKELFRPADILGPQADVKESLESGVVAYEGNITNQIIWVEKHDGDDIIRCRFLSPEHLQLIISEDLS